mgnify:CR=1 FL=1|jgi:hypothetical protein
MRYALRKQDKIKEVLGKKYLENNRADFDQWGDCDFGIHE